MAGHRSDKMALEFIQILTVFHAIHILPFSAATLESHGQAFIQTDHELRYTYTGDQESVPSHVISGHNLQDMGLQDINILSHPIHFDPPTLDFKEQRVGMPHMQQVTVHNADTQNSLHLLSISGSTSHFHCSFFQDKMVPPSGNTTFDVVFLARQVGNVENTLYIHTSQGSFKYQVFGVGIPNPYRIRPLIGAKVPVNSSFNPLIHMHNPHSSTLQVVEMYSSGGDLHLELPTGEKEAPQKLWEIPPFETKPVMRANFVGRVASNHTAFIRIKTNREKMDEILVLPVEVEVTSSPGIFSPLEMLDFGILRTIDSPKILRLNLLNSGTKPVHISSITVSPPNDAISIDFRQVKLQPDIIQTTPVAFISFMASQAVSPRQLSGKIIVKSKTGQYKVSIPYQATVLYGSLEYDQNKTMFFTGHQQEASNVTRAVPLTNAFNFTLVIYNASLAPEAQPYFTIEKLGLPVELHAQQVYAPFKLKFHPRSPSLHLSTHLIVYTNASVFYIPLLVYNGKLKVVHHRPEIFKGQLDFGTMGIGERRSMTFTLRNDNPVDIVLSEFGCNMEKSQVELLGVEKGNATTLPRPQDTSTINTNPLVLKPYHYAVFSVHIVAPSTVGTFAAEVIITTQHEYVYIPITLRTADGSLYALPEKLYFEKCFPSKVCSQNLLINSTFDQHMEVQRITFQPNDSRFYYLPLGKDKPVYLHPHNISSIGKLYFEASLECSKDCYLGLATSTPAGHQWLLGARLDKEVADTDQYLYTRFRQQWSSIGTQHQSTVNVTIQLDTSQIRGFLFPAQAHLQWPSVVNTSKIRFPLTQIGNLSVQYVMIENPSDVPLLIQLLPLSLYPSPQTLVDLLSPSLSPELSDYIDIDDTDTFTLQDLEKYSPNPINPIGGLRRSVENTLGVRPHPHTIAMFVGPGSQVRARIGFYPKDDLPHTSLIIIRNNLTIIDGILVEGQGGRGEMRFSNRKAGSQSPLQFEMTADKHLKACDKKKSSKSLPASFTMKRTFTIRNTGQLSFYVHGFNINQMPCEGYGFKVLDCQGFELAPNASRKIDIAFTPDFTMSRMRRTLSVLTSLGPAVNYTLQATIPGHMLTRCAGALPRPPWEPILYYSTICIMAFLLFCILVASYFEADRIFTADILRRRAKINASQMFDKSKVFDLKTIAGVKPNPTAEKQASGKSSPSTPPVELANGHIEFPKKKSSGWSLGQFFKRILRRTSPEIYHSSESRENKPSLHPTSNGIKPNPVSTEPDTSSTTYDKNNPKTRKTKATKRHHSDLIPEVAASDGNNKIAPTSSSVSGLEAKPSTDHHCKTSDITTKTSTKKTQPEQEEPARNSRRTKQTKWKQEGRSKEKTRSLELYVDERDETSSTTTDSSVPDVDEKTSSARESTPEPQPLKKKAKTKKEKKNMNRSVEDDEAGEEFVITSKSKAHKKIRIDPKSAYGGNIHCPSSLELPYKTKLEAQKESELDNMATNPAPAVDKIRKTLKNRASKVKTGLRSGTDSETSERESPPPVWDAPLAEGDLSDLASQTELFATKLSKPAAVRGPSPDSVSSGSSYSSVVSNGSCQTPVSLDIGRAKYYGVDDKNKSPTFGNEKHPGAIGSKAWGGPSSPTNTASAASLQSGWLSSKDTLASGYGLHGISDSGMPLSPLTLETPPTFPGLASDAMGQYMFSGSFPQQATMMQKLQADRRKRLLEYQQKLINGEEWPGFGVTMQPDSLWSQTLTSLGGDAASAWTPQPDSPKTQSAKGLWDSPRNPVSTLPSWNPSIWSSAPSGAAVSEECAAAGPASIPDISAPSTSIPEFDPFGANLGNIWQPGNSADNSMASGLHTWPFAPQLDKDDSI